MGLAGLAERLDSPSVGAARLHAFQTIVLMILGVEYWCRALRRWEGLTPELQGSLVVVSLLVAVGSFPALRRSAFLGLAAVHGWVLWLEFPAAGNHAFLELYLCLLSAYLAVDRAEERILFVRATRWIFCLVLFYAGLQKFVHGYYFHGQYLAFSVWIESFRPVLAALVPASEFARIVGLGVEVGAGPYLVDSRPLLIASNLVWIAEIIIPFGLLARPTRALAVVASLALVAAIEAGARELFFGMLYANLALLFTTSDWHQRFRPVFALALAALLLSRLGILPEATFF